MTTQVLYPIHITKERRKHIQLRCCPDFSIEVKAPFRVSEKVIIDFVDSKKQWIEKHMRLYKQSQHMIFPKPLVFGSTLYYLGHPYQLTLMTTSDHRVFLDEDRLVVCFSEVLVQDKLAPFLMDWYKDMAFSIFTERLAYWVDVMNVTVSDLKVKQFKARWGSCSLKKIISLNWILVKAPLDVIDYVIVHECCHLVHFDHSKQFWNLVNDYMPDYKEKKRWLKEYGVFLLQNH